MPKAPSPEESKIAYLQSQLDNLRGQVEGVKAETHKLERRVKELERSVGEKVGIDLSRGTLRERVRKIEEAMR